MDFEPTQVGPEVETARRLALLTNGYDPLPLVPPPNAQLKNGLLGSKAVILTGWPRIDFRAPDIHRTIQGWQFECGYFEHEAVQSQTTGIRFPTAIDLDIDHEHIEDVLDALALDGELRDSLGGDWLSRCPIRTGGGQKLCILAGRAKDVLKGKIVGATLRSPENNLLGHVEVFHGQGQVGASGVHSYQVEAEPQGFFSPKLTFTPAILYNWLEGPTPFDTRQADLPKLSRADLARVQAVVEGTLSELGWAELQIDEDGSSGTTRWSYTLDTEIVFDTLDGEMTYDMLYQGLRVAMHTIVGDGHNRNRGWVFQVKRNGKWWAGIHDHQDCINYLPPEAAPISARERGKRSLKKANELATAIARQNRPEPRKSRERLKPAHTEKAAQ